MDGAFVSDQVGRPSVTWFGGAGNQAVAVGGRHALRKRKACRLVLFFPDETYALGDGLHRDRVGDGVGGDG